MNEISSVICQNPNVKLGILPFGTGNDLSGMMNLPSEPEAAIDLLLSGEAKYIDMGIANGTKFTNVCGIGFDVDVLINTERHKKGRKGMLPYFLGIVDSAYTERRLVLCRGRADDGLFHGGYALLRAAGRAPILLDVSKPPKSLKCRKSTICR